MSHDEKVEWLRQKFFSLKNAIHRTHVFDNNGNRLRAHLALGYQSIRSAMLSPQWRSLFPLRKQQRAIGASDVPL